MFDPESEMRAMNNQPNDEKTWEFMDVELNKPFDTKAENGSYKACLTCFGKCQIATKYFCSACGCGPIKIIEQGSVGLKLRFGKYVSKLKPGLYTFNPCTEEIQVIDMRAQVMDVGNQSLLTKDNVTLYVDAYVNFRVTDPEKATFKVVNYRSMIIFFTQGVMKTIIAEHTLTEILAKRKEIELKITQIIDEKTHQYGLKVFNIETQKIQLPVEMDRAMAAVAESQKQSEARLIDAKGNLESAKIFKDAADILGENEISLQLQYFETLKFIAAEKNKTIIVPDSLLNAFRADD